VRPSGTPIGLQLAHSAKHVGRAFNDALAEVGGSVPTWFILTNLKGAEWRTQHELARALHIEGPTLTRHIDGLEEEGLVVRRRDASDRRAVSVELTDAGRAKHAEMLRAVQAFNQRLLAGFSAEELDELQALLGKLEQNARAGSEPRP
jgi:MarR family transcriptional regulator for hemolysin